MGVFDDDYEREDRAELLARIASLEAALQRLASPTQFCPDDPVAEVKARCEYAEKARAALAPAPAPKGKSWIADLLAAHPAPEVPDA